MTASTLLAALIAASSATNGVITVGDTQPFDQVRLYQNPANGTVLTNQSSDGSIDTSTTALVITGSTAPTGLVFDPNLSVLRNVTSDIKLLVDTPVELTLTVNLAGTLTQMTVEAGKTAVLTLGLIAGIPMIVGAFGFFPVASPSNDAGAGLQLVNATYANGLLEHTGGEIAYFYTEAMSALIDFDASTTVRIPVPSSSYTFMAVLSNTSDPATALDNALASVFAAENTMGLLIEGDLSEIGDIPRIDLSVAAGDLITFGQQNGNQMSVLLNGQTYLSRIDPALNPSLPLYLYLFVTDNHSNAGVPIIPMVITKSVAEQ